MSIVIGIDPGLTGALAAVDSRGSCAIEDLPTVALPGNGLVKRRIDGRALAELLRRFAPAGSSAIVLLEQVRAMGGQNNAVQTQFSLGRTLGGIETLLDALRLTPTMVEPQAWKRFFGIGSDKGAALDVARSLYPVAAATALKRQKDHNRAEALLIAHFGLRTLA